MKQLLFTLAASVLSFSAMAQIVITAPPVVVPNVLDSSTLPVSMSSLPSMAPSSGGSWDLDSISIQAAIHTHGYLAPTRSFPAASISDSVAVSFWPTTTSTTNSRRNFIQSSSGVVIPGEEILTRQAFSLGSVTGNMLDSIVVPIQAIPYTNALQVTKYPMRKGSKWSTVSHGDLVYTITITAASVYNMPVQHRRIRRYLDSVVGWGSMTVPMPGGGGSAWIQVLQLQHTEIVLDSLFFLTSAGPTPVPASILSMLGLSQGQTTIHLRTDFYRAGAFRPLATAIHSGPTFSSAPSAFYMDARNLPSQRAFRIVSANRIAAAKPDLRLFPNPVRNGKLFIDLAGNTKEGWNYALININGQVLAKAEIPVSDAPIASIMLPQSLSAGIYYLTLINAEKQTTVLPLVIE